MKGMNKHYLSPNVQALFVLVVIVCFFLSLLFGNSLNGNVPSHLMYTPLLLYANVIVVSSALHPLSLKRYLSKSVLFWLAFNIVTILTLYSLEPALFTSEISATLANLNFLIIINIYLLMALLVAIFFRFLTQFLENE